MGSGWFPRVIFHAVDTPRYVWSSSTRLTNVSVPSLNGDDGDEASSLRTNPGRKSDEVIRCALYGQPFQVTNRLGVIIKGNKGEHIKVCRRISRAASVSLDTSHGPFIGAHR
jgi:hypothetical protein